ncbi:MAG: hypothetical protein DIU83_10285 [Bacillota bacterium]|nr:MAG: hypothetical protein DIU83_10285 [Bacillota bacterium]
MSVDKQRRKEILHIIAQAVIGACIGLLVFSILMYRDKSSQPAPEPLRPASEVQLSALAQRGAELFDQRGCATCHSTDGSASIGPTVRGVWGSQRELEDGSVVLVDEAYVRESIVDPQAKIAKGYLPAMASYAWLPEDEIDALVAFFREMGQ